MDYSPGRGRALLRGRAEGGEAADRLGEGGEAADGGARDGEERSLSGEKSAEPNGADENLNPNPNPNPNLNPIPNPHP